MFKKLVSHLKFSPSLIGELASLANRLRVQNPVRIAGVISLGLLLVIQIFLYVNPPTESSSTYAGNIFFDSSIEANDIVNQLNNNYRALGDIFTSVGITKENILQSNITDNPDLETDIYRLSRWPISQSDVIINYNDTSAVYLTPVSNWGEVKEKEAPFISGEASDSSQFYISNSTGSMYLTSMPKLAEQESRITLLIEHINASTQSRTAKPLKSGDRIKLTLTALNSDEEPQDHTFRLPLGDSLEYLNIDSNLESDQSPSLNKVNKELSWPATQIPSRASTSREITLKVRSTDSNIPQNSAHPYSQDCIATFIHGNQLDLPVECTVQKELEMFTGTLTSIPEKTLLIWTGVAFLISLILLAKALQEEEEIRIIRHKFNSGT